METKPKGFSLDKWLLFFGVILYLLHFFQRDPSNPYERPIISDAKGYYAYLPALFIYQDLDYNFIEKMDDKYYAVGHDKHIFIEVNGNRVNKTFPGVAVLYLPFFLIAHFLALILGLEADGYSLVYQYLFDFGQFFYATLGFILAGRILSMLKFGKVISLTAIILVILSTNLWYYTIYDQSVTHIYNFFLINAIIYLLLRIQILGLTTLRAIMVSFIFCLLLIVRPTGILSVLLVPVFIDLRTFRTQIIGSQKYKRSLIAGITVGMSIILLPMFLWKLQADQWIVYSYGDEGFDFSNPQFFNFLFSYAKGWYLYSPILLILSLFGLGYFLFTRQMLKLVILSLFLFISVFVFSSWWCWYYGFSFGQRPMVDFYLIFILLLAELLQRIKRKYAYLIFASFGLMFILINLLQSYQQYHGFYKTPTPTKEMYWDNFLNFKKTAKIYRSGNEIILETIFEDFEDENNCIFGNITESKVAYSGEGVICTNKDIEFSSNMNIISEEFKNASKAIISFELFAETDLKNTVLVCEYKGFSDTYQAFRLDEFSYIEEWTHIEFSYDMPALSDTLVLYFWNNQKQEKALYDDIRVEILK